MKPTISIALITLGLTLPAPALAVDYVQCEAMKRRFNAEYQWIADRAWLAQESYWKRTVPPKPEEPECVDDGLLKGSLCPEFSFDHHTPEFGDPRWKKGMEIYCEALKGETPAMRRIKADMKAAGCF